MDETLDMLKSALSEHYSKYTGVPLSQLEWTESRYKYLSNWIRTFLNQPNNDGRVIYEHVVSYQTLERIFTGKYELTGHAKKESTLDILAAFLGYTDWADFSETQSWKNKSLGLLRHALSERVIDDFNSFNNTLLFDYSLQIDEGENSYIMKSILANLNHESVIHWVLELIFGIEMIKGITTRGIQIIDDKIGSKFSIFKPKILYYNTDKGSTTVIIQQLIIANLYLYCKFDGDFVHKSDFVIDTHFRAFNFGNDPSHWEFIEIPQLGKSVGIVDQSLDNVPDLNKWNEKYIGHDAEMVGPWPSIQAPIDVPLFNRMMDAHLDEAVNKPNRNYSFV